MDRIGEDKWVLRPGGRLTHNSRQLSVVYETSTLEGYAQSGQELTKRLRCQIKGFERFRLYNWDVTLLFIDGEKIHYEVSMEFYRVTADGVAMVRVREVAKPEYSLELGVMELAVENLKNYRLIWNHALVTNTPVGTNPNFTVADAVAENIGYYEDWVWTTDPTSLEKGWRVHTPMTKPGKSNYVRPSPTVVESIPFETEAEASKAAIGPGVIKTPATAFGLGGEWLTMGAQVRFDGQWWWAENRYQNADEWDKDFYTPVAPAGGNS